MFSTICWPVVEEDDYDFPVYFILETFLMIFVLRQQAKMVLITLSRLSFDKILQMKHNLWQPT